MKEIKECEDIFETEEFKSLTKFQKIMIRLRIAIITTLSMI